MSEQEITRPDEDEDVEAHRSKRLVKAGEEAPKDDESEDDVELHATRSKIK